MNSNNVRIREAIEYVDLLLEDLEADDTCGCTVVDQPTDLLEFIRETLREQLSI